MSKLSKSKESDRQDLILGLADELHEDAATAFCVAAATVDSDWFAEVRSTSFWTGAKALADLLGVELDDYTRQSLVDPYEGQHDSKS